MSQEHNEAQHSTEFLINESVLNFNRDTKIYRYIDYDTLLQVLDGKLYVSTKKQFADLYDAGNRVPLHDVFKNFITAYNDKEALLKKHSLPSFINLFKTSANYLASCWTLSKDNYLMWKTYTHGNCGICIESTASNFIASLDPQSINPYLVCCSPMFYDGFSSVNEAEEILFRKLEQYNGEQEVRFYFLEGKQNNTTKANTNKTYVYFKIDPEVMIDKLIISPFMRGNSAHILKRNLEENHSYLKSIIEFSQISE